jgi:hypothetical protein
MSPHKWFAHGMICHDFYTLLLLKKLKLFIKKVDPKIEDGEQSQVELYDFCCEPLYFEELPRKFGWFL